MFGKVAVEDFDGVDRGAACQCMHACLEEVVGDLVVGKHRVEGPPLVAGRAGEHGYGEQRPMFGGEERVVGDHVAVDGVVERPDRRYEPGGDGALRGEDGVDGHDGPIEAFTDAERVEEEARDRRGRGGGADTFEPPTLEDRAIEGTGGGAAGKHARYRNRAGGLAGDGDVVRIAAERTDLLTHPSQRGELVAVGEVRRRVTFLAEPVGREQ